MLRQILEIVSLPFITGAVGYFTNKLAIKMLFRPYLPKWYTLGWQGIVPRSRKILASKISATVASTLISESDIEKSLANDKVKSLIRNKISDFLQNISGNDIKNAINLINLENIISKNTETINIQINSFISDMINNVFLSEQRINNIAQKSADAASSDNSIENISNEIISFINNFVNSGKTINELLPDMLTSKKDELAKYIHGKIILNIREAGRSADIKDAAAQKVLNFKNSFFGESGFDTLKMGFLNMFLDDDTIANTVKRELPSFVDDLAKSPELNNKIYFSIKNEINNALLMTLPEVAQKLDNDALSLIYTQVKMKLQSDSFKSLINNSVFNIVKSNLQNGGIVSDLINVDIVQLNKYINDNNLVDKLSQSIAKYINNNSNDFVDTITLKVTDIIKQYTKPIVKEINIEKIVEKKINSLDISEVEEVLFSFMKDHFKWINILGFIIGFVIGGLQVIAMLLMR